MARLSDLANHIRHPLVLSLFAGTISLGAVAFLRSTKKPLDSTKSNTILSPKDTVLPKLSHKEFKELPYPPDGLPGARDVDSPYGSIRVYEWGPGEGERVLLIHGISTPSIALADLAHKFVERGCRVMLFDLFGRGYSSAPSPHTYPYNSALYTTQILICLSSSPIPWSTFTLVGYSLGGALAVDFTSYFPHLVSGLVLLAPGGLIRTTHISWKSRLLYSTSFLIPAWITERLVAGRLYTGPEVTRSIEPEPSTTSLPEDPEREKGGLRSDAVYTSSHTTLLPSHPHSTVGEVVDWQIQHHAGFVPAFISSIRYAPIHGQQERWRIVGENMRRERQEGGKRLREVCIILGQQDPIILAPELLEDAKQVLGKEGMRVNILEGVGHEVAIECAEEIVKLACRD